MFFNDLKQDATLFNKQEFIAFGIGCISGIGITLLTSYICDRVTAKKELNRIKDAANFFVEKNDAKVDDIPENVDEPDEEFNEEDNSEDADSEDEDSEDEDSDDDKDDSLTLYYQRRETDKKIRIKMDNSVSGKHPLECLDELIFKDDIYWINADCYRCCQTSIAKKKGEFWGDAITKRPLFNGWSDLSYIYLPSNNKFYADGADGPSPDSMTDDEQDRLMDTIGAFATNLVINNYGECDHRVETRVDTSEIFGWAWQPDLYFIDTREGQESLYHFRTLDASVDEDDYLENFCFPEYYWD